MLLLHVFLIGAVVLYNIIAEKPGSNVATQDQPVIPSVESIAVDASVTPRSEIPAGQTDANAVVETVEYIVTPGQNLQSIAEATGATTEQISALNNLNENGALYVGRKLLVPRLGGGTVSAAAPAVMMAPKAEENSASKLVEPAPAPVAAKALDKPAEPRLEVAKAKPVPAAVPVKAAPKLDAPAKPAVAKPVASSSRSHQVQNGETFYGIARKHDVNVNELMKLNGFTDPGKLRKGTVLKLPAK
ncbi:LysM peptidoglycan-binding domain-containing protein [Phragmitibacter flavus]|uniref:LysM peptidoglycan-binding domain-containing protein n=1 Tax=Phragmitibacter flavus TaxID=2576071 RepID=UPI00140D5E70|nr:LysM peptidoglycan-binding domain-containing protein [Phragmitibacter flavus]